MAEVPKDFIDEFRALQRKVAQLEGRANIRPALDQVIDGPVTIGSGGQLSVEGQRDPGFMLLVGAISPAYSDGSPQKGLLFNDDNSPQAQPFSIFAQGANDPSNPEADVQVLYIRDPANNIVLQTDAGADGLARPYVPIPLQPSGLGLWASTSNASFEDVYETTFTRQHPRIRLHVQGFADTAGATGEMRMVLNGTPTGPVPTLTNSVTLVWTWIEDVPGTHMDSITLQIQARRATGAGSVRIGVPGAYGSD